MKENKIIDKIWIKYSYPNINGQMIMRKPELILAIKEFQKLSEPISSNVVRKESKVTEEQIRGIITPIIEDVWYNKRTLDPVNYQINTITQSIMNSTLVLKDVVRDYPHMVSGKELHRGNELDVVRDKTQLEKDKAFINLNLYGKKGNVIRDNTEWISVKDEQPEKSGFYLCYIHTNEKDGNDYRDIVKYSYSQKEWFIRGASITDTVTHWQILPEPPKE